MSEDIVKDANGARLSDGDSVTLIKDLKVKGSGGVTLKRGTLVKKIDRASSKKVIHANAAARTKSRLSKSIKAIKGK